MTVSSGKLLASDLVIEEATASFMPTVVKRITLNRSMTSTEAYAAIKKVLGEVHEFLFRPLFHFVWKPYARYAKNFDGDVVVEVGYRALTSQKLENGLIASALPAGKEISAIYEGP